MIELKKEFTKKGITFKQMYKSNCLAIYSVSHKGVDDGKARTWYEVFRILVKQKDLFHYDDYEKYPNDEAFGQWAWSCSSVKSVEKVLNKHFKDCGNIIAIF